MRTVQETSPKAGTTCDTSFHSEERSRTQSSLEKDENENGIGNRKEEQQVLRAMSVQRSEMWRLGTGEGQVGPEWKGR